MKKMTFMITFLLGTFSAVAIALSAPAPVPTEILFGQKLFTQSLAEAERGMVTGYGEGVESASQWDFAYKPVSSTIQLGNIFKTQKVDYVLTDPRKRISIDARVQNEAGEDLFIGYGSFTMVSRRDAKGTRSYVAPEEAGYIYFQLTDRKISVAGAEDAMVQAVDGSSVKIEVKNGVVTIPSFAGSDPGYWNTLWVLIGGEWVRYDSSGNLINETSVTIKPNQPYFNGGLRASLDGSSLSQVVSPEYGWNPVIEFDNQQKQVVTLNLSSEWGARPTFVRVYTLDQKRKGEVIRSVEYDLEGDSNFVEEIQIELNKGTYFIEVEWPTWIEESRSNIGVGVVIECSTGNEDSHPVIVGEKG